jgi:hypothetical protein
MIRASAEHESANTTSSESGVVRKQGRNGVASVSRDCVRGCTNSHEGDDNTQVYITSQQQGPGNLTSTFTDEAMTPSYAYAPGVYYQDELSTNDYNQDCRKHDDYQDRSYQKNDRPTTMNKTGR